MKKHIQQVHNGGSGAVYGVGMIGALVYYVQHADSVQSFVVGIVKAFFWPGFFVYRAIEMLGL